VVPESQQEDRRTTGEHCQESAYPLDIVFLHRKTFLLILGSRFGGGKGELLVCHCAILIASVPSARGTELRQRGVNPILDNPSNPHQRLSPVPENRVSERRRSNCARQDKSAPFGSSPITILHFNGDEVEAGHVSPQRELKGKPKSKKEAEGPEEPRP